MIETLKKICSHQPGSKRETCDHPWTIPWKDSFWTLATDGKCMLFVHADHKFPGVKDVVGDNVLKYLQMEGDGVSINLTALKEWAGPPLWSEKGDCLDCATRGTISCAECQILDEDENCGADHRPDGSVTCEECGGLGKAERFPIRTGQVAGYYFNRNYLACLLEEMKDVKALMALPKQPGLFERILVLRTPSWRLWLMCLNSAAAGEGTHPEFAVPKGVLIENEEAPA